MAEYTSNRFMDGKVRQVIVDETGKVVNRNPSKEELKGLKEEVYTKKCGNKPTYTDKELLDYLIQFYEKYGRVPIREDFTNNPGYPSFSTYRRRFGGWNNALKLVGLDIDSMVKQGLLETSQQKGRRAEIKVINHFIQHPIDLAGENKNSHCDGICPDGKTYDVKSSKLCKYANGEGYWRFHTINEYKEEIEIYYFMAFNEDYSKLEYGWKVPGEIAEKDNFYVGTYGGKFNVENMEEYDITDKFNEIINKQGM